MSCWPQGLRSISTCPRHCLTRGPNFWKRDRYERHVILYLVAVKEGVDTSKLTRDTFQVSGEFEVNGEMLQQLGAPATYMGDTSGQLKELADGDHDGQEDEEAPKIPPDKTKRKSTGSEGSDAKSKVQKARGTSKDDLLSWQRAVVTAVSAATVMELNLDGVPFISEREPKHAILCFCLLSGICTCKDICNPISEV
jgi:hypothetical protein